MPNTHKRSPYPLFATATHTPNQRNPIPGNLGKFPMDSRDSLEDFPESLVDFQESLQDFPESLVDFQESLQDFLEFLIDH